MYQVGAAQFRTQRQHAPADIEGLPEDLLVLAGNRQPARRGKQPVETADRNAFALDPALGSIGMTKQRRTPLRAPRPA